MTFVIRGRPRPQPARAAAPIIATAAPAIIGTRSKKPISGLWRAAGLSAIVLGLAMLRVERKPTGDNGLVQFYQGIALRSRKNKPVGPLAGRVANQVMVSAPC